MINFTNKFDNNCENLGFFIPEDKLSLKTSKIDEGKKDKINKFLKRIEKNKDKKKLHSFDISDTQRCFVIILGEKLINFELNNLGGSFKNLIGSHKNLKSISMFISENVKNKKLSNEELISEFLYGYNLKSYSFEKYKSKKKTDTSIKIDVCVDKTDKFKKEFQSFSSVKDGVFLARDLVSEPPNELNPKHYTEEIFKLTKLGLKIEVFGEKDLKKMGMNSLLGVGQGSSNETFLVTFKWNGKKIDCF